MSDGGAKEQQQGGFYCFCQIQHQTHIQTQHRTPSNPHSNPHSNPIEPIQTQHRTIIYINEDGEIYVKRYNPSV